MIKPLCDALHISANELLCGERIKKEDIEQRTEESIINTINYSQKAIKNTKVIFATAFVTVMVIILALAVCMGIDISRMISDKEVVFGKWGFEYSSPVDRTEAGIKETVIQYFVDKGDDESKHHENEKTFVAVDLYLVEPRENGGYNVYLWVLEEKYYEENGVIKQDRGSSIPYKVYVEKRDGGYVVKETKMPRDGSYYDDDIRSMFPLSVQIKIFASSYNNTYKKLNREIIKQAERYFNTDF